MLNEVSDNNFAMNIGAETKYEVLLPLVYWVTLYYVAKNENLEIEELIERIASSYVGTPSPEFCCRDFCATYLLFAQEYQRHEIRQLYHKSDKNILGNIHR